jgi:Flp pilus assembly protein TadB
LWEVHKSTTTYDRAVSIRRGQHAPAPVASITSAPVSLSDDQARRQRRYLVQMAVRLACFLAVVIAWPYLPTLVAVLLLVGAVVLPYTAVLSANAGRERSERVDDEVVRHLLEAAPDHPALPPETEEDDR